MADVKKIFGYDIKDATARAAIEGIGGDVTTILANTEEILDILRGAEPEGGWIKDGNAHYWIDIEADDATVVGDLVATESSETSTVIDWGDGTTDSVATTTTPVEVSHTYTNPGKYRVDIIQPNDSAGVIWYGMNSRGSTSPYYYASYVRNTVDFIELPDGVTSIGKAAFSNCSSLQSITILDGVTSIGDSAFSYCSSLRSITIPDGVTSIGKAAFSNCSSLQSITIPDSVTSIGDSAFRNCSSLQSITILDGVTSIGTSTFGYCSSLRSITIPDGVTSIGNSAFSNCSSLQSITIPDGVTSIGDYTFYNCSSLQSITILCATPPTLSNTNAIPTTITAIYVPSESVDAYKAATNWSSFASKIQAIPA